SIRQEYVEAARGLIYDRNGNLLVDNQPIYSVTITPLNFDDKNIPLLAELLGESDSLVTVLVNDAKRYSRFRTSKLISDIDFKAFSLIQENLWQLPGIGHQIDSKRNYPSEMTGSHVFGYLREADEKDYKETKSIRLGDKIGKSGLELYYQDNLKGDLGINYLKVNALGQSLGKFTEEKIEQPPIQGDNLTTTIDADLQAFAEKLMKGKSGGIVAMNPHTGEILALVSSPEYEVKKLAGRIDKEYWQFINSDSTRPLFNRAISSRQPPGSTFKPLMGIIGLHLGIVTPETEIYNSGYYMRGRPYKDLADPGLYNLESAIAHSSNTYFLNVMDKIATSGKLNTWSRLAKDFGLGVPNQIDLPSANRGILPDSAYLDSRFGKNKWGLGDVLQFGIGQGLVSASPLQIAQMTSSIVNGGYKIEPHLLRAIQRADGSIEQNNRPKEKIDWVKEEYLNAVKKGMRRNVLEGSGRFYAAIPDIEVAGKTGTAQNPLGFSHGWYTSFAPADNPEIVVTVFLENAGFASISAVPVASLILEKYLKGEVKRDWLVNYVLNFVPKEDNSQASASVNE
ncbi:MAG TPA: penicillin-binding protein 2, partial [Balneola sp.]|nr:penicillin-binding protein 2 [Balneola sp.]